MAFPNKPEPTDLERFERLLEEWGLLDKEKQKHLFTEEKPYIYHCTESQTLSINALEDVWYFDVHGNFLYINEPNHDSYLHRGGEFNYLSGREHLYED